MKISQKVFDIKKRIRLDRNKRINDRIKTSYFQFQPGQFVLMSTKDIFKNRSKLKLNWIGPMLVERILGDNYYLLIDPIKKEFRCHSSRMRFYDGSNKVCFSEEIKEVYLHNVGKFYLEKVTVS